MLERDNGATAELLTRVSVTCYLRLKATNNDPMFHRVAWGLQYAVLIYQTVMLLGQHFTDNILALFRHVLASAWFSVGGQCCELTDGVALGLPTLSCRFSASRNSE